jgi:signal transduction histidine kinase
LQSAVWLYMAWHVALPLCVIICELFEGGDNRTRVSRVSARAEIGLGIAVVIAVACAVTWFATAKHELLPALLDHARATPLAPFVTGPVFLLGILALSALWIRKSSVLDLWLMVMICAWLIEIMLSALLLTDRFSLGWYMGRIYSLIAGSVVLIVLLSETTTLYARLARSIVRRRREHEGRLMTMDSVTASIAHEVNQPLAAIVANGNAAMRLLANTAPDLDEARAAVKSMVSDGHRAAEVITSIRAMFKNVDQENAPLDINKIIRDVLALMLGELRAHQVSIKTELNDKLPDVRGNRIQLQQVILNLIANAIDAMNSVTKRPRVLRLKSAFHESDGVLVLVEDSGTGIDPDKIDRIFDSFFTTKSQGMGMGLSLCQSIIEAHDGRLWVSSEIDHGTVFSILLPAVRYGAEV